MPRPRKLGQHQIDPEIIKNREPMECDKKILLERLINIAGELHCCKFHDAGFKAEEAVTILKNSRVR